MGEVYKAWDRSLKRHVALKILPPEKTTSEEMLRRLAREARAASALNHPNIVTVYEIGHADVDNAGVDFIAMELVEGETVRSFLSRTIELPKALHYMAQIAEGLAKAHAAGILHRDLKPENIMITSDGFAKILDFGLAKTLGSELESQIQSETITVPGTVMGTIAYMSPEQVRGLAIDHRSDIFSFGCILYEMLTRRRPFQGTSEVDAFHKIVYEPPSPIGEVNPPVSDALRRITFKCLSKDPEDRYQSAKDIAVDLREIRREYESGGHVSSAIAEPKSRQTTPRTLWLWIAAALLTITAAAWIWSRRVADKGAPDRGGLESMTIERLPATSNVQLAAISPDGRYIAHVESTPDGDVLLVRQAATGSEIQLAPADTKSYHEVSFSEDGEYVRYVHDGALRESPVLGGPAKILLAKLSFAVLNAGTFSYPVSFSPDGKRFAFIRDGSLFLADSDGSDERRIASGTNRERYLRAAWSPREEVIACIRQSERIIDTGNMWIDIFKLENETAPTRLGEERWFAITSLTWLPDARGIAVSARRGPLMENQLFEITYPEGRTRRLTNDLFEYDGASMTADGKILVSRQTDKRSSVWILPTRHPEKARRIVEGVGFIRHLTALPDGDILYGASLGGGNLDIWRTAMDGKRRVQLTHNPEPDSMPAASPDGRTIAFISARSGQLTIWTMDADGTHPRQLTTEGRDVRPRFSPDGTWLVYSTTGTRRSVLHRIAVSGGDPSIISTSWSRVPAISPDGRFIAALSSDLRLGVISAKDGSPVRSFDQRSTSITELRWTKDSRAIAFERQGVVYLQDLAGGPPKKIADVSPDEILSFDWTPDGQSLLIARVSNQRALVRLKNFR